jgi:hypothetical protein
MSVFNNTTLCLIVIDIIISGLLAIYIQGNYKKNRYKGQLRNTMKTVLNRKYFTAKGQKYIAVFWVIQLIMLVLIIISILPEFQI